MSDSNGFEDRLRRMREIADQLPDEDEQADRPERPVLPRPEVMRHVKLFTPRTAGTHRVLITDDVITHLLLHRIDGRSEICTKLVRYCYGCKLQLQPRVAGYVAGLFLPTRLPAVFCLTPNALKTLYLGGPLPATLFRQHMRLWRAGNSPRCKLTATLHGRDDKAMVPYQPRAEPVLCRVFNVPALELRMLAAYALKNRLDPEDFFKDNDSPEVP